VKAQGERLEQAMLSGRLWPVEDFQQFFLRHPLMRHLAQLLIWGRHEPDGTLAQTFRVAEDFTLVDANDETIPPVPGSRIGLVHPLRLHEDERAAWGQIVTDYSLVPPFPQISRGFNFPFPEERAEVDLRRYEGIEVHGLGMFSKLNRLGWQLRPNDQISDILIKVYPADGVLAYLDFEPGMLVWCIDQTERQTLGTCSFALDTTALEDGKFIPLGEVPPIAFSETVRDLNLLTANYSISQKVVARLSIYVSVSPWPRFPSTYDAES